MIFIRSVILFAASFFLSGLLFAQDWDYQEHPRLNFEIEHIDADIRISQSLAIDGDIEYNIRFRMASVDSLVLDAVRMNVESVYVNGDEATFETVDETLVVFMNETQARGTDAVLRIRYSTMNPVFGIHQSYNNTIWTSQLPKTTRHWLPTVDSPRISFTTDFSITHASGFSVVANGREMENIVVSVDEETTRFASRYPVPSTALYLAIGNFESHSEQIGTNQFNVYTENSELDSELISEMVQNASRLINTLTEISGTDFPHRDLHIILKNDLIWETRNVASGIIYIDLNRSIEKQLHFGLISQWAGVIAREAQWQNPEAIQVLTGYLAQRSGVEQAYFDEEISNLYPYDLYSIDYLGHWQRYILENPEFVSALEISKESIMSSQPNVYSWLDFAKEIYQITGQPYFDTPVFSAPEKVIEQIYTYSVKLDHNESEGTVTVRFESQNGGVDELVTVKATEFLFNDVRERELAFTGSSDQVVINVSDQVENIALSIPNRDDITLQVSKPFMFWIYQLQNDGETQNRVSAAVGLRDYSENPDLQLALLDIMRVESNPSVYAELLRTLGALTDGAGGTAQLFMDRLGSNQHVDVQIAAIESLVKYPNNRDVISRLRNVIVNTADESVRREAIKSLSEVTDPDAFLNITETAITRESTLNSVGLMLRLLAEKGREEQAVRFSDMFTSVEFPYHVRSEMLELILELDQSETGWLNRMENLIDDRDPRIRYTVLKAMNRIESKERNQLIERRKLDEYDARIIEEYFN